jgi:hypothetical protein
MRAAHVSRPIAGRPARTAAARGVYRGAAYRGAYRGAASGAAAVGAAAVGAAAAGAYGYNYYNNGCLPRRLRKCDLPKSVSILTRRMRAAVRPVLIAVRSLRRLTLSPMTHAKSQRAVDLTLPDLLKATVASGMSSRLEGRVDLTDETSERPFRTSN